MVSQCSMLWTAPKTIAAELLLTQNVKGVPLVSEWLKQTKGKKKSLTILWIDLYWDPICHFLLVSYIRAAKPKTGAVKVKRFYCSQILGNLRNYKNCCPMAHLPETETLHFSFLYLTFNQQSNSCFKSGIKDLLIWYLLAQCQSGMEIPEQCVNCVQN